MSKMNGFCCKLLVFLAFQARVPSVAAALSPEAQQLIQTLTPKLAHAAQYQNTSFSIGIATHNEHFGIAVGLDRHLDPPQHMTVETLIPSGSVAKTYTAAYIMHLYERGILDIDAPASTYADPFLRRTNGTTLCELWGGGANGKLAASVTSRQLMSMRAGMQDYDDGKLRAYSLDPKVWPSDIEPLQFSPKYAVDGWTGETFLFTPDQGGSYSSVGFVVLGWVLAGATNATSWEALDQRAFFPEPVRAALPGFQFFPPGACSSALPNVSHQYAFQASQRESPYWNTLDFVDLWPSSCLNGWTCGNSAMAPKDLAAALYALLGARRNETVWGNMTVKPPVSDAGLAQMQHFQHLTTGWSTGMEYGLGLMLNRFDWDGVATQYTTWVGHGGLDYGSGAVWHFYNKALDVALVISRNTQGGGMNCSLIQTHNGQSRNFDEGAFEGCIVQQVLKTYSLNGTAFPHPVQPCSTDQALQSLNHPSHVAAAESDNPASEAANEHPEKLGLVSRPTAYANRLHKNFGASNLGYLPLYCPSQDCTAASSALQPAECAAWKQFHATLNGQFWKDESCAASFTDPCGAPDYCLRCSDDGAHITAIELRNMSLIGDLGAVGNALGALTQLTSLDVSTNNLFGTLPTALRSLTALEVVRLDSNMLSGTLPEWHWGTSIAQRNCGLALNDFDCPLPKSASSCMPGAGAPICDDPTVSSSPYAQSAKCYAARVKLQRNLKVTLALARVQGFVATVAGDAVSTCGNEIAQNSSCHATLDWAGNADAAAAAQKLRDAVSNASTMAQVCFSNLHKYQVSDGKWMFLSLRHLSPVPLAAECSEVENQRWLNYLNRPSQCVKYNQGWQCSASCDMPNWQEFILAGDTDAQ